MKLSDGHKKPLETISKIDGGFTFGFIPIGVGIGAYQKTGEAISTASLDAMRSADAPLLVAIAALNIPLVRMQPVPLG